MDRSKLQLLAVTLVGLAATAVIVVAANWRLGLLAAVAGALIVATRIRYAPVGAATLLLVVVALALSDSSAGSDERSATACAPLRDSGALARVVDIRVDRVACARAHRVLRAWQRQPAARRVGRFRCERSARRVKCKAAGGALSARPAAAR